jgi:hypothetical protein
LPEDVFLDAGVSDVSTFVAFNSNEKGIQIDLTGPYYRREDFIHE